MAKKLKLSKDEIAQIAEFVEAYATRHNELIPHRKNGINVVEYLESGDYFREKEITSSMNENKALYKALDSLTAIEMRELQGIMYLGRGDFEANAFWKNTDGLHMEKNLAAEVSHVHSKWPSLGEYLRTGISKAEKAGLFS